VPMPAAAPGKGFLGALLDFNFNHLVTTKLIKLFYGLALLMISGFAFVVLYVGLWVFGLRNGQFLGILVMLSSPFVWLFEAVLVRIFMESIVVRFKTAEYLRIIKDKL
jgi:hypothetical protein